MAKVNGDEWMNTVQLHVNMIKPAADVVGAWNSTRMKCNCFKIGNEEHLYYDGSILLCEREFFPLMLHMNGYEMKRYETDESIVWK